MQGASKQVPSETLKRLKQDLEVREVLGTLKYGTTIDRTDLDLHDWVRHAREEAMDLAVYLTRLVVLLESLDDPEVPAPGN